MNSNNQELTIKDIRSGDEVWEESGNCFGDRIKVRVEKVFPDGQCIVTDGDTRKTRNSHVRKLIRYDSKK